MLTRASCAALIGALVSIIITTCAQAKDLILVPRAGPPPTPAECPPHLLEAAKAHVTAKVGESFFAKSLVLDGCQHYPPDTTGHREPRGEYWSVSYQLRIPSKPWVKGIISTTVDSTGTLVGPNGGVYDACDCIQHPTACEFSVSESTAVEAAKKAGFPQGLSPWDVRFQWVAIIDSPCYEWVIQNTLHLEADGCSGHGSDIIIDAGRGEVIGGSGWRRQCCFSFRPANLSPSRRE